MILILSSRGCHFTKAKTLTKLSLLQDGLHLKNIDILRTERKMTNHSASPGIVIATCQSAEDKKQILAVKKELKHSRQYRSVYLSKDYSPEERSLNRNLNALVSALRENGVDIKMNGNRVERGNNDNSERNQQRSSDHRRSQSNRVERDEARVSGFERASYRRPGRSDRVPSGRNNDKQSSFSGRNSHSDYRSNINSDRHSSFSGHRRGDFNSHSGNRGFSERRH